MPNTSSRVSVWDPFVRIFHWSLVFLVFSNLFLTEEGEDWHEWFGYICLAFIVLRIIWGFIGPYNARFSSFYPTKQRIIKHIEELRTKSIPQNTGHNPLGGMMVFSLLLVISSLGISGYLLEEVDMFFGEEWLEELHEFLAEVLKILLVIHVAAVLTIQRLTGFQLIKPMLTGKRDTHKAND